MRIIAGKHRGRKLLTPKDDTVIRPTTDFTREALFNILSSRVVDAEVLDLFGGTGALSLESVSRGAKRATVADRAKESLTLIQKNAASMGETLEIVAGDFDAVCRRLHGRRYDIVFLDPPYAMDVAPVLACIERDDLLHADGLVVYEHDKGAPYIAKAPWCVTDERRYGRVALTFIQKCSSLSDEN